MDVVERHRAGERQFPNADLEAADLSNAVLSWADLRGANLRRAFLVDARLSNANLNGALLARAELRRADLREATLIGARLSRAILYDANLGKANLSGARLNGANLIGANLAGATLRGTISIGANFAEGSLRGADLTGANLRGSNLGDADLSGVKLERAKLDRSRFDVLSPELLASDPCQARIDWATVARSLKVPNLQSLLVHLGVPAVVARYTIDALRSIDEMDLFSMLQTTFISYGGRDERFAKRLHEALERSGVKTWFFPRDAAAGEKIHREERRGINAYDRTILICSESSLTRTGVLNEIERALDKEAKSGKPNVLIPIRLDDHVLESDEWIDKDLLDYAEEIRGRVILDFSDEAQFQEGLGRLLCVLNKLPESS